VDAFTYVAIVLSGVSRVWQAWHVPWAPLWQGRKNCLAKIKIFICSFLNLYFAPHTFTNCKAATTQQRYVGRVARAPPSIMTKLWDCDITWRSDIMTEQECSHAIARYETSSFSPYKKG